MAVIEYLTTIRKLSTVRVISKPNVDIGDDGLVRGQDLISVEAYEVTIVHPMIDEDTVDQLQVWYAAAKSETIRVEASDRQFYHGLLMGDYDVTRVKGLYRTLRIRLRGNRVAA